MHSIITTVKYKRRGFMSKKIFFLDIAVICLLWVGIASAADVKPAFSVQDGNLQAKWENQELKLSLD